MPIRVLPPDVAAKIAAGEVVERPAAVVKELVENSLDAGATQISVEVQGGGLRLMRVADNGCGVPPADVELVFQRYATSKLTDAEDLEHVATLGFRGEALASIAAVSEVHLLTRVAQELAGTYVRSLYGEIKEKSSRGAPVGTTVTIRGLFRNVPARLKFLKSATAEAGRIATVVGLYCMAYPEVKMSLTTDGRQGLASAGTGDLREAVARVYGTEVARAMLEASTEEDAGVSVQGLVSPPSVYRASRRYIHCFVNRRPVLSGLLAHAVMEAYQGLLMGGRYPLTVLNISLPPEEVDVNVHPTKAEIKFRREPLAFSVVQRAVRAALIADTPVPVVRRDALAASGTATASPQPPTPGLFSLPPVVPRPSTAEGAGVKRPVLPALRVLGQLAATYIVAEGPQGMYLIDQHTAHERVTFDKVRRQLREKSVEVQALLDPVLVELSPSQESVYRAEREALETAGFRVDPFGERTYLLRGVPAVREQANPATAFLEALDYLGREEAQGYDAQERVVLSLVCHNVVRAGQVLTFAEMEALVRTLEQTDVPHTCPHGRPTMVHLSQAQLEQQFGRR